MFVKIFLIFFRPSNACVAVIPEQRVSSKFCHDERICKFRTNLSWRKNAHDSFRHNNNGSPGYPAFKDNLGHKDLREKTILFIIDGLYGNDNVNGPPLRKWKMPPSTMPWPRNLGKEHGIELFQVS